MNIKIVRNEAEYEEAMKKLLELMDKKIQPGSEEDNLFELLILVIQDYERQHTSSLEFDPVETIKFHMEQRELSKKDLVPYLGSISRVSEVLSRKRQLSLSMIQRLHEGLEIPLESLIQRRPRQSSYRKKARKKRPTVPRSRRKKRNLT